jgi:hypothetical protein
MRIGIDFDNTIACYDRVFHAAALERGLITADVASDKTSVRDHLRARGRDADFTELQGYVYGARMSLVSLYPGFMEAAARLLAAAHQLFIVSHKTPKPFAGPPYDLHAAAREFLVHKGVVGDPPSPFRPENVFFEVTKEDKIARIRALGCDVFIDDLPEILAMEQFPAEARSILFDCDGHYASGMWRGRRFECCRAWPEIADVLLKG